MPTLAKFELAAELVGWRSVGTVRGCRCVLSLRTLGRLLLPALLLLSALGAWRRSTPAVIAGAVAELFVTVAVLMALTTGRARPRQLLEALLPPLVARLVVVEVRMLRSDLA